MKRDVLGHWERTEEWCGHWLAQVTFVEKKIFWLSFEQAKDKDTLNKYALVKMDWYILWPFKASMQT